MHPVVVGNCSPANALDDPFVLDALVDDRVPTGMMEVPTGTPLLVATTARLIDGEDSGGLNTSAERGTQKRDSERPNEHCEREQGSADRDDQHRGRQLSLKAVHARRFCEKWWCLVVENGTKTVRVGNRPVEIRPIQTIVAQQHEYMK